MYFGQTVGKVSSLFIWQAMPANRLSPLGTAMNGMLSDKMRGNGASHITIMARPIAVKIAAHAYLAM
jgi:hypothetical protein